MKNNYFNLSPATAEISLTDLCLNRCDFCHIQHPLIEKKNREMNTAECITLLDKIADETEIRNIHFTGGDPLIRNDLHEIIRHSTSLKQKSTLVTSAVRCSDNNFVKLLHESGLRHVNASLMSHDELTHSRITGNIESYKNTVEGIQNLIHAGIDTSIVTTICRWNRDSFRQFVKFIKNRFNAKSLIIRMSMTSGMADYLGNAPVGYSSLPGILIPLKEMCERFGIGLLWGSPSPYCIFNPSDYGIDKEAGAELFSLLSINPSGDVIACAGHKSVFGNLLKNSFEEIWNSEEALYFREKKYFPAVCKRCGMKVLCAGASPLYWEEKGVDINLSEIRKNKPRPNNFFRDLLRTVRSKNRKVEELRDDSSLSQFQ